MELKPFSLDSPSLEQLARRLARLYKPVTLHHSPMFAWVQITNDVTILGEELRRQRKEEAIIRAGKALIRLLEFIGYYSYEHKIGSGGSADLVAQIFRSKSFANFLPNRPEEGPTRWIVVKYPYACSKCGRKPCYCVIEPWALEKRREYPERYETHFKKQAFANRRKLRRARVKLFTIRTMIEHFRDIYSANYYHEDSWKIGMHLSEEVGEATIELGRVELKHLAAKVDLNMKKVVRDSFKTADQKIDRLTNNIVDTSTRTKRRLELKRELGALRPKVMAEPWEIYLSLVGDKLKEEIADVLSWLAAIIIKLDWNLEELELLPSQFTNDKKKFDYLCCVWCRQPNCDNYCLVGHAISSEMVESISKF